MRVPHAISGVWRGYGARFGSLLALTWTVACTNAIPDPRAMEPDIDPGSDMDAGASAGSGGDPVSGRGGESGSEASSIDCSAPKPGTAPLRRLSNAEYRNTVTDLFLSVPDIAQAVDSATREFPAESESLGFRNSAAFLTVQSLTAQKYLDAAEILAVKAARTEGFVSCTPIAGQEMSCARSFLQDFGKQAFRRPLNTEEASRYEAQFQTTLSSYDFSTAVEWTVFAMLQSPAFLYRVERGRASAGSVARPTAYETASRLSYLFWQSAPDAALLHAAEAGELDTNEQVAAKARKMLGEPRAERLFQYFSEWLDLDRLDDFSRDPKIFPDLPADLGALYREESRSFVQSLLSRPDGSFSELLSAPYTYANQTLAGLYGLKGAKDNSFVRIDDARRSGVLTQALLFTQDKPYRTSIVRRGLKVRTDLLCQNIPAPPPNVQLSLDSAGTGLSQRDRLAQHRKDPSCASCHSLLDPVGLVLENFDGVGRYRTLDETGQPIVTISEISDTRDANGSIADARALGELLAASSQAQDCYVTQSFRFFFGREVEAADACSIAYLKSQFIAKKFSLAELLVALTQTDAFLYRPTLAVSP